LERVARREVDQGEADHGDAERDWDGQQDSAQGVVPHPRNLSFADPVALRRRYLSVM
jgi:hypothetical protein